MSFLERREIPIAMTAFCGIIVLFNYYISHTSQAMTTLYSEILSTMTIITVWALLIGAAQMIKYYAREIRDRKKEWWLRIWCLFLVVLIPIIAAAGRTDMVNWFMQYVELPAHGMITGIALLYWVSGTYRTFRLRGVETALLIFGSAMMMMMSAPLYSGFLIPGITPVSMWLRQFVFTGVVRGGMIGATIGLIISVSRTYVGAERALLMEVATGE